MKKHSILWTFGVVVVLAGAVTAFYWAKVKTGGTAVGLPEGYEEGSGSEEQGFVRVEKLDIEESALKYENLLELVAFSPGSGWLRFKTSSGISPLLSFNRVRDKDVDRFNRFSQSLGLPIRAELNGNVLRLSAETDGAPVLASDSGDGDNSTLPRGFYEPEDPPRLAISKDSDGNVLLVEAEDSKDDNDEDPEALVAKTTE